MVRYLEYHLHLFAFSRSTTISLMRDTSPEITRSRSGGRGMAPRIPRAHWSLGFEHPFEFFQRLGQLGAQVAVQLPLLENVREDVGMPRFNEGIQFLLLLF